MIYEPTLARIKDFVELGTRLDNAFPSDIHRMVAEWHLRGSKPDLDVFALAWLRGND